MGCVWTKPIKIKPLVSEVKEPASPASAPKVKEAWGASKVTSRRETIDACATDACRREGARPGTQGSSSKAKKLFKQATSQAFPVQLVKEAVVNQMTSSTLQVQETPVSLFVKPTSKGSLKSDALLSAESRDSGICVTTGGSKESANIITESSSPEKQELAQVLSYPLCTVYCY